MTAAGDSSSLSKGAHPQPLDSTDASAFPQVDPTWKEVISSGENQRPSVTDQAHTVPASSDRLDGAQDENWFEEPEEKHSLPDNRYDLSSGQNQHVENTEIKQKPLELRPRNPWWLSNFNLLQTKYFWTNTDAQDVSQFNQTEDPYSMQSIEWRSLWFDQAEENQSADSAKNRNQGENSTESVLCNPLQLKAELDMRAHEDGMKLLDVGDDEEGFARILHWLDDDPQAIRTTWELQDRNMSDELWERTMIWLLRHHPDKAVHVLWSTFTEPYPNLLTVLDTVKYLSAFYFMHHPKYTVVEAPAFVDFFLHVLRRLPKNYIATNPFQRTVHLILTHSNKDMGLTLYSTLRQENIKLHRWTNLHFAYFFARQGLFKLAAEILEEVVRQGHEITSYPFLSTCNKIIRSSLLHPEGYHSNSHLVSRLMDMGVQFDTILYNVLLANAVEAGDLRAALQLFELIERSNKGPDDYTWSIILIGCKSCHDPVFVDHILSKASSSSLNYWAATDLMHCIYLHANHRKAGNIYSTVLKMYLRYFDPSPLQELGILPEPSSSETPQSLPKPPSAAIGLMLSVFLEYHGTEQNVMEIYNRFRAGILNGSILVQRTLTDHTYNTFLYSASRWPTTLHFCTGVLRDMSTPLPDNVLPRHPETKEILTQAQPTVQTWNILLQAFVRHNQPAAAEKVLDLMRRRGLKPSTVTWNSIINAYARVQDVRGVVDALMRREKSGFWVDKHTRRALKRVKNKETLVKLLNEEKRKEGKALEGKEPIAEYQQSQLVTAEEANSLVGEDNHHPFENSHWYYSNDESAMFEYDAALLHGSRV